MQQTFLNILCAAPVVAVFLWALVSGLSMPVVYASYSTGECVKVETAQGEGSCEDLPKRYTHVWLK